MKIVEFLTDVILPIFLVLFFLAAIGWLMLTIYLGWQLVGVIDDCGARQVLLDLWHGTEECGG